MPQDGYSYDELVKMGAKPGGYTYEELTKAGATPADKPKSLGGATGTWDDSGQHLQPSAFDQATGTHIGSYLSKLSAPGIALGAGQEFTTQLHNAGDMVRKIPILGPLLNSGPSIQVDPALMATRTPSTDIGHGAAKVAEFAAPSTDASLAMKAAGIIPKMAAQAGIAGGVGLAQGQTLPQAAVSAGTAGLATGALEGAWPTLKEFTTRRVTPRVLNSLMEVNPKWLESGADPGGRLAKDGLVAGSKDSMLSKVTQTLDDTGRALDATLVRDGAGKQIDASPIMDAAITNAKKRIGVGSDPAFQSRLDIIMNDVAKEINDMGVKPGTMSPVQAQKLKSAIGDSIKWNGTPFEGEINQVLVDIYRGLNDATEEAVPGSKSILSKWQDYQVAKNSLTSSLRKESTRNFGTDMSGRFGMGNILTANVAPVRTPLAAGLASGMNPASAPISGPASTVFPALANANPLYGNGGK